MTHHLKTLPEYYEKIVSGDKKFEIRENDRGFRVGDTLCLEEYSPEKGFSGFSMQFKVSYILYGGNFGIEKGYCAMSLVKMFKS